MSRGGREDELFCEVAMGGEGNVMRSPVYMSIGDSPFQKNRDGMKMTLRPAPTARATRAPSGCGPTSSSSWAAAACTRSPKWSAPARGGWAPVTFPKIYWFCMALSYGRAGRFNAKTGGSRRGQYVCKPPGLDSLSSTMHPLHQVAPPAVSHLRNTLCISLVSQFL